MAVDFNVQFAENAYTVQFEETSMELDAQFEPNGGGGGGGGTDNYNDLSNKPKINNVTLSGNKSASDLGLATPSDIPSVDATLTTQGAAADAKATGDAVTQLMGDITEITTGTSEDIGKALSPKTVSDGKVTEWQYVTAGGGGGSSPSPYTSNPAALGTASPGSSDNYARGDHVHAMPTAAQVGAEASTNKVTSLSSSSTDTQYPSAKCVYDLVGDIESLLSAI